MLRADPGVERVGEVEAAAGECQPGADLAGAARQEVGGADIGEEADAGLRHGEGDLVGHHPMRAVHRDAHTAAHDDAVDERDVGLGVAEDPPVETVLLAVEPDRILDAVPGLGDRADVAAGAEGAAGGGLDDHGTHLRVLAPGDELERESLDHAAGQRVEGPLPIEDRHAEPALALEADALRLRYLGRHQSASSRRAMMTRMISLVPSRI